MMPGRASNEGDDFPETFPISEDGETLRLEDVLTGRGFVTGKSGSGKSNTASVVAEELLSLDLPLLVVDTDGEYVGLKEAFAVLHAGADGRCDVQVSSGDGERLAELALSENVPVVLDVSGFLDADEADALIAEVLRHLFHTAGATRKPFLVMVEEMHEFVPQQGGLDEAGELLVQIVKRGRKRGLGVLGLSQRPAAVDKEFVTQCDWLVWHRLTWESDVDVVRRFLAAEYADLVEDLDTGEAIVVTDWDERVRRVRIRRKETFDAGATPSLADVDRPEFDRTPVEVSVDFGADDGDEEANDATRRTGDQRPARTAGSGRPPSRGGPAGTLLDEGATFIAHVCRRLLVRSKRGLKRVGRDDE